MPDDIIGAPSPVRIVPHLAMLPPVRLWGMRDRENTEHTLELTVTGRKNAKGIGTFVSIDQVNALNGEALEPAQEK